jgi:glycerol-3-phosphate acyltransferase PlsY
MLAYVLGSIPSAYLAGRWSKGIDLRQHGSGNLGATNVFRVLGPWAGSLVLLADIAKGAVAVLVLPHLGASDAAPVPGGWWPCVLGLAAVLGHSYTCFLGFKGGKGVATSLGVFLGLAPWATGLAVLTFALVFGWTRMVSAGSLLAAVVLPVSVLVLHEWAPPGTPAPSDPASWWGRPVAGLALLLGLLVWLRHIPNMRRIASGTENRFVSKKGNRA